MNNSGNRMAFLPACQSIKVMSHESRLKGANNIIEPIPENSTPYQQREDPIFKGTFFRAFHVSIDLVRCLGEYGQVQFLDLLFWL